MSSTSKDGSDECRTTDEAILSQQREIEKEVREKEKQIGDLEEPSVLLEEYHGNEVYYPKINQVIELYKGIRRSRKDGSCFYRSFIFAFLMIKSNS